ncbi:MAG: hypothetical protein M1832_002530 [Thelocarpon impressellum]|nr:MAG: hypothetical protein M1832_002530 [Thelocarpon impressellum]
MAGYDSDSSSSSTDYTSTSVLLGYASAEPTDDAISQLGGHPTWLDETRPPSASLARCKVCNGLMSLLLQLNGNLPEVFPGHERRLWVFGCRGRTCAQKDGSVRAVRGVRVTKVEKEEAVGEGSKKAEVKERQGLGQALFNSTPSSSSNNPFSSAMTSPGSASNPFSTGFGSANPFSTSPLPPPSTLAAIPPQKPSPSAAPLADTFAAKLSLNLPPAPPLAPPEPWPASAALPLAYTRHDLDADYETLPSPPQPQPPAADPALAAVLLRDGDLTSTSAAEEAEAYESSLDKTFQRFSDRLAENPLQVLRYEWAGQPLLYSREDAVGRIFTPPQPTAATSVAVKSGIPPCPRCNAARVFEAQLTPRAITELEAGAEGSGAEGMEWGTVILGVCSRDCALPGSGPGSGSGEDEEGKSGVGYGEEWCGVQWEGRSARPRR